MMNVHLAVADAASRESGQRHMARGQVETPLPFEAVRRVPLQGNNPRYRGHVGGWKSRVGHPPHMP